MFYKESAGIKVACVTSLADLQTALTDWRFYDIILVTAAIARKDLFQHERKPYLAAGRFRSVVFDEFDARGLV